MSLMRPVLNAWLRLTEKPHLARARSPEKLRRSFEAKARLFFHAPRGSRIVPGSLAGLKTLEITPSSGVDDLVVLYFHGGAYIFGSPRTHSSMLAQLVHRLGAKAILPDYRKAPEHPFPAAPEDAIACYRALLDSGVAPGRIVIGGDSAGGGLSLSLLGQILATGLPKPAGVFAFSPVVDLTYSGESVRSNAEADVVLPVSQIQTIMAMYLGDQDPNDPKASPLNAEFEGAPPVWLVVGDTEILRDDSVRMADHLRAGGVDVKFEMARDLPHVWPIFHNLLPEARKTLDDLAGWIRRLAPRSDGN